MKVAELIASKIWVRGVPQDASLASESMRLAARLRLRGADAVYVALAAACHEPLVTLDTEMLERTRGVAEAFTPEHNGYKHTDNTGRCTRRAVKS